MAMSLIRSSESHYTSASMYALNHSSAQCLSLPSHQADHLTLCPPLLLWAYPWSYAWKSVERPALCIASATCLKLLMLSCHILKLVNTPTAYLTVKAQVYITCIWCMAHAYPSSGNYVLYRNKRLTIWNEFYKMATWDNRVLSVIIKFNVSWRKLILCWLRPLVSQLLMIPFRLESGFACHQ